MPPSFFNPLGLGFIQGYSEKFNADWGPEWSGYSLAYLVYLCTVSMHNFGHPKFKRSAPPELQVVMITLDICILTTLSAGSDC